MKNALMYVLSAIVILNVVFIVVLNNRLADQEMERRALIAMATAPPAPSTPLPLVRAVILEDTGTCPDCFDSRIYLAALEEQLNLTGEVGDLSQFRARIALSSVMLPGSDRLPAIAFSEELAEYDLVDGWDSVGYMLDFPDGDYAGIWYVLPTLNPPYYSTTTGRIHGRVTVTYLTDDACTDCYDPAELGSFLDEMHIVPATVRTIDISSHEGAAILEEYSITAVPTLILDEEADAYSWFAPSWEVVGSQEADGTFVLRELQRLQVVYHDLALDRVMRP